MLIFGAMAATRAIKGGRNLIMPTSVNNRLNRRSELAGSNSVAAERKLSAAARRTRSRSATSSALAVGCIALPLRTNSGSENCPRKRCSILLIAGCVVSIACAVRVMLRSWSNALRTRSSRKLSSGYAF